MRRGGLALIAIFLLGGITKLIVPQAQPSPAGPENKIAGMAAKVPRVKQVTPQDLARQSSEWYPTQVREKIRDFFGQEHGPEVDAPNEAHVCESYKNWCVPHDYQYRVHFVIATSPDPVHSHLSLFFDRSIDAIEQGATSQGYLIDRAIIPWLYFEQPASQETGEDKLLRKERESYPGILIFRSEKKGPLFVLVVGETPTAGINKEQFHHAVTMIHEIREGSDTIKSRTEPDFGVLGPNFSGSLHSLQEIFRQYLVDYRNVPGITTLPLPVYSIVMGTQAIKEFQQNAPSQVQMAIFLQDGAEALQALVDYAKSLSYDKVDIAVLNEDDTAYGTSPTAPSKDTPQGLPAKTRSKSSQGVLELSFPRGISQFRSAYSKDSQNQDQTADPNQSQRQNMRLDLEVTGSDDDNVAPYAKAQTALSQEAIMLAIVSELGQRGAKFILIRATDPLDELFLARYLSTKYSQARLVVPTPDLLFARDEGGLLDGTLGLNTYPVSPAYLNPVCFQADGAGPKIFPAASSAGFYNATVALLKGLFKSNVSPIVEPEAANATFEDQKKPVISDKNGIAKSLTLTPTWLHNATVALLNGLFKPKNQTQRDTTDQNGAADSLKLTAVTIPSSPVVEPLSPAMNPCHLSANIWLTIVSRNSIYPIEVLRRSKGSLFFPKSDKARRDENDTRSGRIPATWALACALNLALVGYHLRKSLTRGGLGQWQTPRQTKTPGKAWILLVGAISLTGMLVIIASSVAPFIPMWMGARTVAFNLVWGALLLFVFIVAYDFLANRKEQFLACLFVVSSAILSAIGIAYAYWSSGDMVLWQQRALDLASHVSPTTPLLLLLAAFYSWFWFSIKSESLTDWRCPQLPSARNLPENYDRLTEARAACLRRVIHPFTAPWWVLAVSAGIVACVAVPWSLITPGYVPLRSLEGLLFDSTYSILFVSALALLIATLLRIIALWREFRLMLTALDRPGLGPALQQLKGFEWDVIWNPIWSMQNEVRRLVSKEIQVVERLRQSLGSPRDTINPKINKLRKQLRRILSLRRKMMQLTPEGCPTQSPKVEELMGPFKEMQGELALTAGVLCKDFLDHSWKMLPADGGTESSREGAQDSQGTTIVKVVTAERYDFLPEDPSGLSDKSLQLAGEFVACIYANFLATVLLRIRWLVFSTVVIYTAVVFSSVSYPFQPAPSISALALILFLFEGGVVGYVYEEMHRDVTLRRLTSTDPNKVDSAFWLKLISAGLLPLLGLLTALFPQVGHLLYTIVAPILQATR